MDKVFHYRVSGTFDPRGQFSGSFINQRSGEATPLIVNAPPMQDEESCGQVGVTLNIYDREPESIDWLIEKLELGSIGRLDARRLLNENIGVGIFRDGFRIRPYGDPEADWLELERRRVQDPSLRIGHNQVWGNIEVEDERDSGLVERSSREGFEHNGSFRRLRHLVTNLLIHVEQTRRSFRESAGLSRSRKSDASTVRQRATFRSVEREIEKVPAQYRARIEKALRKDEAALQSAIFDMEEYQHALASRSTLGLVVSQVLHDGRRFLSEISTRSHMLTNGAPRLLEVSPYGEKLRSNFADSAKSISQSSDQLNKLFKALDPISGRRRGRPFEFDVERVVNRCMELFRDALETGGIESSFEVSAESSMGYGYEADAMAAILNILDNAIHWVGTAPVGARKLRISLSESKKYVTLRLSNTGQRIGEAFEESLFNPGFTLKSDGSGIGLAIAREAMRASKGDVTYDESANETTFVVSVRKPQGKAK